MTDRSTIIDELGLSPLIPGEKLDPKVKVNAKVQDLMRLNLRAAEHARNLLYHGGIDVRVGIFKVSAIYYLAAEAEALKKGERSGSTSRSAREIIVSNIVSLADLALVIFLGQYAPKSTLSTIAWDISQMGPPDEGVEDKIAEFLYLLCCMVLRKGYGVHHPDHGECVVHEMSAYFRMVDGKCVPTDNRRYDATSRKQLKHPSADNVWLETKSGGLSSVPLRSLGVFKTSSGDWLRVDEVSLSQFQTLLNRVDESES